MSRRGWGRLIGVVLFAPLMIAVTANVVCLAFGMWFGGPLSLWEQRTTACVMILAIPGIVGGGILGWNL